MNAHQRRKVGRARHMLLPLSKEIDTRQLMGRRVYVYGKAAAYFAELKPSHLITSARITRHIRPFNCVDLELRSASSDKIERVQASVVGLRLSNPADKAPRPWWCDTARRHREERRAR